MIENVFAFVVSALIVIGGVVISGIGLAVIVALGRVVYQIATGQHDRPQVKSIFTSKGKK